MSGRWLSLDDAFQRVVETEGMAEPAFQLFAETLMTGKIECRGYRKEAGFYGTEDVFEVTEDFWRHVDPRIKNGRIVFLQSEESDYFEGDIDRLSIDVRDYNFYVAFGDFVCTPQTPQISEKKTVRGGRPTVHNWAVAAAVAAAFVAENDYPEPRTSLVETMRASFADAGSCPDKREIEKFVATMYEEGHRLERLRNRVQTR